MRNNLFLGVAVAALIIPAAASAQDTTSTIRGIVYRRAAHRCRVPTSRSPTSRRGRDRPPRPMRAARSRSPVCARAAPSPSKSVRRRAPRRSPTSIRSSASPMTCRSRSHPKDRPAATSSSPPRRSRAPASARTARRRCSTPSTSRRSPRSTATSATSNAAIRSPRSICRTAARSAFAGINPRFNRFSINGVSVSDNFGLNPDANPTGRGPIPFDAIGQFSVSIAPFDFRQGNFQGGAIDATLKSGTNQFHGTGFYSQNTDGLYGERIGSFTRAPTKYKSETYGATLSGPIIKDKLFFMVSGERNIEPRPLRRFRRSTRFRTAPVSSPTRRSPTSSRSPRTSIITTRAGSSAWRTTRTRRSSARSTGTSPMARSSR